MRGVASGRRACPSRSPPTSQQVRWQPSAPSRLACQRPPAPRKLCALAYLCCRVPARRPSSCRDWGLFKGVYLLFQKRYITVAVNMYWRSTRTVKAAVQGSSSVSDDFLAPDISHHRVCDTETSRTPVLEFIFTAHRATLCSDAQRMVELTTRLIPRQY